MEDRVWIDMVGSPVVCRTVARDSAVRVDGPVCGSYAQVEIVDMEPTSGPIVRTVRDVRVTAPIYERGMAR